MNETLHALYDGELCPAQQHSCLVKEIDAMRNELLEKCSALTAKLESPLDKELESLLEESFNTHAMELYQAFADGYRLGAKMTIEIFQPDAQRKNNM